MSRKTWVVPLLAMLGLGLGTPGCGGARTILRGQSPEHPSVSTTPTGPRSNTDLAWWEDPRLATVKPRDRSRKVLESKAVRSLVAVPVVLGIIAFESALGAFEEM